MKRATQHTSNAALFAVAAELSRRGYDVAFTIGTTKKVDMLCSIPDGSAFKVQVKGISNAAAFWIKSAFFDGASRSDLFLVVVLVPKETSKTLQFFILSHKEAQNEYQQMPREKKDGRPYTDEESGLYWSSVKAYENKWDTFPPVALA